MDHHFHLSQNIRQDQRLIMSTAMEQAFHVLQMPIGELSEWLENEVEQNPTLHLSHFQEKGWDTAQIPSKPSLYDHLMREISLHFSNKEEKEVASFFAGSLDEKGFLDLPPEALEGKEKILKTFQRMDPLGIGARDVQEALLIQLEEHQDSLIYKIVAECYEDLLHCRLKKIEKRFKLKEKELKELIQKKLRPLNPYPGKDFHHTNPSPLIPDVTICKEEERWIVEVNNSSLPAFEVNPFYLDRLEGGETGLDEVGFIRRHLAAGKWLIRTLERRKKTLQEIATYLLKREKEFFEGTADTPTPLTMREIAQVLNISESTVGRAIANKSIATPRGLLTLRSFFSYGLSSKEGTVSNKKAKNLILKMIREEKTPLSDAALAQKLEAQGIVCARRTVTKYRKELKIGSASQRKVWRP